MGLVAFGFFTFVVGCFGLLDWLVGGLWLLVVVLVWFACGNLVFCGFDLGG